MRTGASISGGLHGGLLLLAVIGTDWLSQPEPAPLGLTEVTLVDGARFDAALSSAPVRERGDPETMAEIEQAEPVAAETDSAQAPDAAPVPARPEPDAPEDAPVSLAPPPPTAVPSAAARPSIAEVPTPETLPEQAAEPESPAATEVIQPLAAAEAPDPGPRPERPPDPEPAPEAAEEAEPDVARPEDTPPRPSEVAGPDAPLAAAPQEARLPVARPADRAAAARASRQTRTPEQAAPDAPDDPEPQTAEAPPEAEPEPEPEQAESPAAPRFAAQVTEGEQDALRIGLKRHFRYFGTRSDPTMSVRLGITLNRAGRIVSGPDLLDIRGGTEGERQILRRSARNALVLAANADVFAKLPEDKYDAWRRIHVTFTPEDIGFTS